MARKNPEPIITQAAILSMAGQHIQSEIIKLRLETADLTKKMEAVGKKDDIDRLRQMQEKQVAFHMERLEAIETMYRFETGTELGYIDELSE